MTPLEIVHRRWCDLKPPRQDARKKRDPAAMARLKADIAKRGLRNPLFIKPDGEVITGESRRQVAVELRLEAVPCVVIDRELTPTELKTEQLQENECRNGFATLERADLYQDLLDLNGWSPAELAEHLGHPNGSLISKTLTVKRGLAAELREHVTSGKLPFTAAYHIARVEDVSTQLELATKVMNGLLKRDSVAEVVGRLLGGRPNRKEKPVRLSVGSVAVVIAAGDLAKLFAAFATIVEGLRKLEKHGLPVSALPSILKSA